MTRDGKTLPVRGTAWLDHEWSDSLLDPTAVARALEGYAGAAQRQATPRPLDLADALISLERDRLKAEREAKAERGSLFETRPAQTGDLWAAGLEMVWKMIK